MVIFENSVERIRKFWYHRYTYNATPGSRTYVSDTIKNGYAFCLDPEAYTDEASLPAASGTTPGMVIQGQGNARYVRNVVKPTTGVLGLFAGVVVDAPAEGFTSTDTTGGFWVTLCYSAEVVKAWVLGNMSTDGYETPLSPVNGQWYLGIQAAATVTNNTSLLDQAIVAKPLVTTNISSAALAPVRLYGRPW